MKTKVEKCLPQYLDTTINGLLRASYTIIAVIPSKWEYFDSTGASYRQKVVTQFTVVAIYGAV